MLLLASSVCGLFKWRQFEPEVILLAVGWYLRFSLSYRDVEELLAERGLHADHVTVWRWVQRYAPEMERRLHLRLKPKSDSWRVDETYIRVKGKGRYLYRAGFGANLYNCIKFEDMIRLTNGFPSFMLPTTPEERTSLKIENVKGTS